MKTQREKRLSPAAKVIIAAAIVIGIPLVEFFWWMRFVHLGVPYYEADSYEELDETCSDAPYHMILPAENTIPFENGTYFVNLNGNQRNASLAGYSIHSEVHVPGRQRRNTGAAARQNTGRSLSSGMRKGKTQRAAPPINCAVHWFPWESTGIA